MEVWFRWFSFSIGWFLGSSRWFSGVYSKLLRLCFLFKSHQSLKGFVFWVVKEIWKTYLFFLGSWVHIFLKWESRVCCKRARLWWNRKSSITLKQYMTGWWFQTFLVFIPTWGNDPIWQIFFKAVETTNYCRWWIYHSILFVDWFVS